MREGGGAVGVALGAWLLLHGILRGAGAASGADNAQVVAGFEYVQACLCLAWKSLMFGLIL